MNQQKSVLSWVLLIILAITWGTSYILIKKGLVAYSSLQLAALRIFISFLAFLPFFVIRYSKIDWKKWKALLVVGLAGSGIPAILFAIAQTELSSSLTGVLSSLTPLFTLVLGLLFFHFPFKVNQAFGIGLGLLGAIVLISFGTEKEASGNPWFSILVVAGCLLYALSSNTVKTYLQEMSSLTISAAAFFLIGPIGIILLISTDFLHTLNTHPESWNALGYIAILSLAGTVVASILFFKLVQMRDAIFASTVSYLIPIVALFWGFLDGEIISWYHFAGMGLILWGLSLTRSKKKATKSLVLR